MPQCCWARIVVGTSISTCFPATATVNSRPERNLRLAEPDIAADEPVHRARRLEVFLDRFDRAALILGLAVWEPGLELLDPFLIRVVRDPDARLALGVKLEQLAGHLTQMLSRADLEVLPGLAAELRERRGVRVRADVAGDLADLLVRHVDAVFAAESEQQVVAGDAGDLLRLESEQLRNAVVLVDDVVARAQIGEARERAAGRRDRPGRAAAEDLGVWQDRDPEVAPDEATPHRRHGELQAGRLLPGLEHLGLDTAEEPAPPLCLAAMRERDDDVEPLAEQSLQLVLGLRDAAGDERRALRLERVHLPLRERVELGRAVERDLGEALLGPDRADLVRLPDEIGGAWQRKHEIGRDLHVPFVWEPDLAGVEPPLGCRVDGHPLRLAERALSERRERTDALDLVTEELDPERFAPGARKDIDEPASHGDLPALLDPLDALVAGKRQLLGKRLDSRLVPARELERHGPLRRWRHAFRYGERGGADEPAAGEHVECASSLADEMRRRLEAGAEADTA